MSYVYVLATLVLLELVQGANALAPGALVTGAVAAVVPLMNRRSTQRSSRLQHCLSSHVNV
jgi:hypothetical protein